MKEIIYKSNHTTQILIRKTIYVLLMLGMYSAGQAMIGVPIGVGGGGGVYTGPIGDNTPIGVGDPVEFNPNITPPCALFNTCSQAPNYIPVWQAGPNNSLLDCVSPLYVRKDAYTCSKQLTFDPFGMPVLVSNGGFSLNPSCPNCNIGFVGINATQPEEQLHVIGNVKCQEGKFIGKLSTDGIYGMLQNDPDNNPFSGDEEYGTIEVQSPMNFNNGLTAGNATIQDLSVSNLTAGSLSVSSLTNNGDLFVNGVLRVRNANGQNVFRVDQTGQIRARRTTVDLQTIPDYVFKKGYKLMPIEELESFVTKYNHLPKIKSESEYQDAGEIDLGELNLKLLEKVEELTLYLIEQDKKIKALEAKMKKVGK